MPACRWAFVGPVYTQALGESTVRTRRAAHCLDGTDAWARNLQTLVGTDAATTGLSMAEVTVVGGRLQSRQRVLSSYMCRRRYAAEAARRFVGRMQDL